jgi:hypothetical protein
MLSLKHGFILSLQEHDIKHCASPGVFTVYTNSEKLDLCPSSGVREEEALFSPTRLKELV